MTQGQPLTFRPSPVVAERIAAIGRTEDLCFSPDQTRLAIAGFNRNRLLIVGIRTVVEDSAPVVLSDHWVELACPDFDFPHGLDWIDDATLVVANRGRDVVIVPVPVADGAVEVHPLLRLSDAGDGIISSPGSVSVTRLDDQHFELLVCNNYRHHVSRHIVRKRNGFQVVGSQRLFGYGLDVPDGLAVSRDAGLVAVSNHNGRRVDIFCCDTDSGPQSPPVVSLGGARYPHGLRFTMDDRLLLVADAGAPHVHVFVRGKGTWETAEAPHLSIRVMDDDTFQRLHAANPEEGGPKGLDILADGSLFVVTCEEVPLAFFDLRPVRELLALPDIPRQTEPVSGDTRLVAAVMGTMRGQLDLIRALQAETARLKASRDRRLDRRLLRLLKRSAFRFPG